MKTVFVIDDDGLMREVLSRLLEKNDYRVRAFQSPQHALPLVDCGYPDAIVSDVQMPEMTGLEFARTVRDRGLSVPIVLVTATPLCEVEGEARGLGVNHVFEKPVKDASHFAAVIDRAISQHEDEESNSGLDRLRLSFLTGLAHELRTPLTAIKLALESLFAVRTTDLCSTEGKLIAIGQRNLDRIIRLVEGQLDLLQITLGDVSVARRLACVHDLVERAVNETHPSVRKRVVVEAVPDDDHLFLFTDPDRLRTVVRYLLECAVHDDGRPLIVRYRFLEDIEEAELEFENVRFHVCPYETDTFPLEADRPDDTARESGRGTLNGGGDPFETRAFHRIVASLGGEIRTSDGASLASVSLRFPVAPRFDPREDFIVPLTSLREAATLSGRKVTVLRCRVKDHRPNGRCFSPSELDFFQRCASAVSEGDAVVRGRLDGAYHLVMVERSEDEIDHIAAFLRSPGESGDAVEVAVEVAVEEAGLPHSLRPGCGDDLVKTDSAH